MRRNSRPSRRAIAAAMRFYAAARDRPPDSDARKNDAPADTEAALKTETSHPKYKPTRQVRQ